MENESKFYLDQITDLTRKLNDAEAFKSHFLSNIRNAITNPFTSIVGLSEEIIHSEKEAWKKIIMLASLIHGEAINLDFQLNNIFCAAEIESGELIAEPVRTDVNAIIEKIIQKYKLALSRKSVTVTYSCQYAIRDGVDNFFLTDPRFIDLIIINLLDNSFKFTPAGGNIEISLSRNENNLQINIADTGKGIDANRVNIIFDRFKRLDPAINSIESGHGLGLSIIQYLIELLNGKIELESGRRQGSKFSVTLPEMIMDDNMDGYSMQGNEFIFINNEIF